MSDITTTDAQFDAIVEGIESATVTPVRKSAKAKEATVSIVVDSQSKTTALTALIERSATASGAGESAAGAVDGYEAAYAGMLGGFAEALAAGNTESDIRKALQADQKQSGTVHVGASQDACQTLTALAAVHGKDGDLPEGYVYRAAAKNGGVGLMEGESSLTALVRAVRAPADTAVLKDNGHGGLYGKAVVTAIIDAASTKAEAVEGLLKAKATIAAALKAVAKVEQEPKSALKFLKAASGPLGKVSEAMDEGNVGDADEVRTLIDSLTALLVAAKAHPALAV